MINYDNGERGRNMAQELGRIERPEVSSLKPRRKLLVVPLIYLFKDAPSEYVDKFELYWRQTAEHILNLESKLGKVNRVFHESISLSGEEGLRIMERLNPKSYQIARQKCQDGASLEAIEDRELAEECMDWERCLLVGLLSETVARKVTEFYMEASKKRYEHISKRIDGTLKAEEIAVLFIREGHMVQFPKDIEVFSVAPPALDEIHRWLRDQPIKKEPRDEKQSKTEPPAE
ncbi:MAG TPA: hypothetical protein EYP71_03060 [Dehalococcoidia bacterium]|nr:hypothetical protein [Dehalococcoidia bacterium]